LTNLRERIGHSLVSLTSFHRGSHRCAGWRRVAHIRDRSFASSRSPDRKRGNHGTGSGRLGTVAPSVMLPRSVRSILRCSDAYSEQFRAAATVPAPTKDGLNKLLQPVFPARRFSTAEGLVMPEELYSSEAGHPAPSRACRIAGSKLSLGCRLAQMFPDRNRRQRLRRASG
jgi:hypothetical protein